MIMKYNFKRCCVSFLVKDNFVFVFVWNHLEYADSVRNKHFNLPRCLSHICISLESLRNVWK